MSKRSSWKENPLAWAGLVFTVGLVERALLALVYPVRVYNDTGAYRRLADAILGGWGAYDGTRTPGYPAFLALLGDNQHVYLAQLALGLVMTLLFFWMGWKASRSPAFGALVALAHTFNPGQLFFEASLMTETLATFFVVAAAAGTFAWIYCERRRSLWLALFTGTAAGLAGLTRPLYVPLALWIAFFLGILPAWGRGLRLSERLARISWKALVGVCLPALLLTGAWMNYLHNAYHMWNITTLTGYNLIQHTGYYFEYVPDQYAALRDTYIKYRDARIAQYGTQGNAIWDAIPEMERVSGLTFFDLSRTLGRLSIQLIREHPDQYLKYAAQGWWLYWRAPVYWSADNLRLSALGPALAAIILAGRVLMIGANLVFLVTSLLALLVKRLRELWRIPPFFTWVALTMWIFSIVQTLPDHGDNPRFLIPMQSLLIFWVLWILLQSWRAVKKTRPVYNTTGAD